MESTGSLARKLKVSVQQSGHQMKVMGSIPTPFVTSSFLFLFHLKNGTTSSGQCRKCRNPFQLWISGGLLMQSNLHYKERIASKNLFPLEGSGFREWSLRNRRFAMPKLFLASYVILKRQMLKSKLTKAHRTLFKLYIGISFSPGFELRSLVNLTNQ